jgi:hypothetical protein
MGELWRSGLCSCATVIPRSSGSDCRCQFQSPDLLCPPVSLLSVSYRKVKDSRVVTPVDILDMYARNIAGVRRYCRHTTPDALPKGTAHA